MTLHDIPSGALDLVPLIPITAIVVWGGLSVLKTSIGQALADRIRGRAGSAEEVIALREEVDALRSELEQAHERMEFAERMLEQPRNDSLATPV